MQPNVPPAPPPAPLPTGNGHDPYDFIFSSNQQPKRGLSTMLSGNSKKQRVIIALFGSVVFIIMATVAFSLITSSGKSSTQALIELAQEQTELVRVTDTGVSKARSSAAKNLAITTRLSVHTSQLDTIALLKKSGHKLGVKQLGLKQSAQTDQQLSAAVTNNTFDEVFTELLHEQLVAYRASLQKIYKATTNKTKKQILQTSFNGVGLLIGDQTTQAN